MNKKQLKKRLEKLEETKFQMIQGMHDRAIAEGRADAAIRFAKMLRGLGGGAEALPASTIRKGGQTFDKVRGVDSELKYFNPATRDVKSLDDIKNIGNKPPAVWRKGGDAGATTTATKTAPKAAGAADDVAAAAAKGGKPLSRTATAIGSAVGGGLIGYGLGKMGGDDTPQPTPTPVPPGPDPAPRPTPPKPPKPTPDKDDPWDLRPVKPSVDDTPGSEDWLRRRVNQPTTTDTTKPTDDAKDLADRYGPDSYVATNRSKPADDNIDVKATADRDRISRMVNQTNESLDEILRLAGMSKK